MQRIVQGRRYNTETATHIGGAAGGFPGDFERYDEDLYRTPNGRYFLAGKGGPKTRWRQPVDGGGWSDGEGIIPLSQHEALLWAEEHLNSNDVATEFAEIVEEA
jgi:hypothetical protein